MNTQNTNQNISADLLNKLAKLKNLKDGAEAVGSTEEAANAAEKLVYLLLKHGLTEQDLASHSIKTKIKMMDSSIDFTKFPDWRQSDWAKRLIKTVAHYCMCTYFYDVKHVNIIGSPENVATAIYIAEQLGSKINNAYLAAKRSYKGKESVGTYKRGFLTGCVEAINDKLQRQETKMESAENKFAVMVLNNRALANKFMEQKYPDLITVKVREINPTSRSGYETGKEAGRKMEVNKGIEGKPAKRIK